MEAATPRSPSQAPPYECSYDQGPYTQRSAYPSPARTEGDGCNYMPDSAVLYEPYPSMVPSNHSVHPAQTMYPISPQPTETAWTSHMANAASPAMAEEQRPRAWTENYEPMSMWDQPFTYLTSGGLAGPRHSPPLSPSTLLSQRSSVSYDQSLYSQEEPNPSFVKEEPKPELVNDDDTVPRDQTLTVSPQRLNGDAVHSEGNTVNTSTTRVRSRNVTTRENAKHICGVCGKLFKRSYNYNAHKETHNPKRAKPNACPVRGCGRKFVRRTDLNRHHESVHLKRKNHRCIACHHQFARKDTLRRHTEDGCPKRFDLAARQLKLASARKQKKLPHFQPACIRETFLPRPQ